MDDNKIKIQYLKTKSSDSRVATGAYAGITPNGLIDIYFFSDIIPLPTYVEHEIENGILGKELSKEVHKGPTREVHTNLLIDNLTAKMIVKLLQSKIDESELFIKENLKK